MKTQIVNTTTHDLTFRKEEGYRVSIIKHVPSTKAVVIVVDPTATYREFSLWGRNNQPIMIISSDDLVEFEELTLYETPSQKIEWRGSKERYKRRPANVNFFNISISSNIGSIKSADSTAFDAVKNDASSRMKTIEKSQARLVILTKQVKICPAQCRNLVQTCHGGVKEMKDAYDGKSEDDKWQLYSSKKLGQLISSLDKFLSTLGSIQDLLQDCGINRCSMALAVALPLPPPEGMSSKFDVLSKELHWNLETIQYALHLNGDPDDFKWNDTKFRYVLERIAPLAAPEVTLAKDMEPEQFGGLVSADRKDLLSQLEKGSILVPGKPLLSSLWCHFGFKYATDHKDKLAAELLKRLQKTAVLSNDCRSIPDCFWINAADLKLRKKLSGNSNSKSVWKGEWCGQPVAIGITKCAANDIHGKAAVEKEARLMLKVQHPNIVGFLGCAFTEDAPPQVRSEEDENCSAGFLVMELMQGDLRHLIDRRARSQIGNPFTLSVTIDILSQIASAMVHMHNLDIMHRDLKSANCLVNTRFSSNSSSQVLKLIDFDRSKELDPNAAISMHTLKAGTVRWMAPEVLGVQFLDANRSERPLYVSYTRSADVWSFGMTCYEVITGKLPFYECALTRDLVEALRDGERPSIPASVSCPEGLKTLMSRCWAQEPSDRPVFKDIEKDLWTIKYQLEIQ